jgi:DMSO/TMAO reductase YedYZ molybdopterin-dependent catalytic subunit
MRHSGGGSESASPSVDQPDERPDEPVDDGPAPGGDRSLPPGQQPRTNWPVLHYGPVPRFRPETWDFRVFGAVVGGEHRWTYPEFSALPRATVVADLHCVTKFTVPDNEWTGVPTSVIAQAAPPADGVTHVMVWAEYGFSANMRLSDFLSPDALLATHRNGEELTPDHGFPVRLVVPHLYAWKGPKWMRGVEYLTDDRRGFWEERGYHNRGEAWTEQRYSYQEQAGEGPPL